MTVDGLDVVPTPWDHLGTAIGHLIRTCRALPEERVVVVAETLEHAAELLANEVVRGGRG